MFLYPTPELPDDTPIDHVRFATRIRNVLNAAGIKTVGEGSQNLRQNAAQLTGPWIRLCHTSSRDAGPAVDGLLGKKPA